MTYNWLRRPKESWQRCNHSSRTFWPTASIGHRHAIAKLSHNLLQEQTFKLDRNSCHTPRKRRSRHRRKLRIASNERHRFQSVRCFSSRTQRTKRNRRQLQQIRIRRRREDAAFNARPTDANKTTDWLLTRRATGRTRIARTGQIGPRTARVSRPVGAAPAVSSKVRIPAQVECITNQNLGDAPPHARNRSPDGSN